MSSSTNERVNPRSAEALREHDEVSEPAPSGGMKVAGGLAGWLDDRTGGAGFMSYLLKKTFPDHWTFMLGEIAMYTLIICLLTGTFLTFWFVPSAGQVVYDGSYLPLQGITMSEAYQSTVRISFDVRGGLLIRQIHHWAALLFIVAITVHMLRVFFTGAFRKPREINWVIGTLLSMLALLEGFAGYSLPDDLLSGTGLRAAEGFIRSIPVIGSYMTVIVFGGPFPGEQIIPLLFSVHILLLPAIIVGLFTAHIVLVFVHKHTQYPGPGRTNMNVVGYPFMPVYIAKAGGFFFLVFGVCALIAGLVTINPIWAYGPYDPSPITAGSQPDWYMGFADGALRLLPGWLEFVMLWAARGASTCSWGRSSSSRCSSPSRAPTRSSRSGSPRTTGSTTCSTGRATPQSAPASASWRCRSTSSSSPRPATTSSPSRCTCRSTTSPTH
jgi:ubiquinol-cytochrome c reductase cytochrome b subunit